MNFVFQTPVFFAITFAILFGSTIQAAAGITRGFNHDFDLGTVAAVKIGSITVSGTVMVPDAPALVHVRGKISGATSVRFEFDVPTEQFYEFSALGVPLRLDIQVQVSQKSVRGRIQTRNFPSGEWSNATWVQLTHW
jgi:hypothetical protein